MKVLIIGTFHHKNKEGLELMLSYLNFEYKWGNYYDISDYDLIFLPDNPIDTSKFPLKKFIFGNHFSVFPTNKIIHINNIHKNSVYIQPSEWASQVWRDMKAETFIPIKTLPFAVNVDKFKPIDSVKDKVFIYFKARKLEELNILTTFLNKKNIQYEIFDYRKKYNEKDYIECLQKSKYGIWLGRHESQGFALQEALSMNVPLLVWDVKSMNQEEKVTDEKIVYKKSNEITKFCHGGSRVAQFYFLNLNCAKKLYENYLPFDNAPDWWMNSLFRKLNYPSLSFLKIKFHRSFPLMYQNNDKLISIHLLFVHLLFLNLMLLVPSHNEEKHHLT